MESHDSFGVLTSLMSILQNYQIHKCEVGVFTCIEGRKVKRQSSNMGITYTYTYTAYIHASKHLKDLVCVCHKWMFFFPWSTNPREELKKGEVKQSLLIDNTPRGKFRCSSSRAKITATVKNITTE